MLEKPRDSIALIPLLVVLASPALAAVDTARVAETYDKVPLQFEANRGQADVAARFLAHGVGYGLYLTSDQALLVLAKPSDKASNEPSGSVAVSMSVVGARTTTVVSGVDELPGKASYFIGNDPSQWRTNVPTYAKVRYSGVYPGIDLVYYGQQRQLEYDFVVAPGADPDQIALRFEGASDLEIDAQGDLVLHTAVGDVRQHKPVVYQETDGIRREIAGAYVRKSPTRVGFEVAEYDHSRPLVIDPVLLWSTLLGGAGASGVKVDAAGNVYVTGMTSTVYPTTPGAFNAPHLDGALVLKLNSTGSTAVYATLIGGAATVTDIAVDSDGNAYVTGATNEVTFPTTPGALRTSWPANGLHAAFVTKLNASGSNLVYSTYLGGSGTGTEQDDSLAIALDATRNAYVAGLTTALDFPTTPGAFQTAKGTDNNFSNSGFVTKLNPTGSALVYSTYLGGSGGTDNEIFGIAVDALGEAFVVGGTDAADFPTTPGAFQTTPVPARFMAVPFVTKLNSTGSALGYSTFFGGAGRWGVADIAVDGSGHAYVVGSSGTQDFPVTPGAFQTKLNGPDDAIVAKFDTSGSSLVYATFIGGSGGDGATRIAIDVDGNAFVTGTTNSTDFPTTQDACQPGLRGADDIFVTMLDPNGAKVVYSTFLGGSEEDTPMAIAVDTGGTAYVTGFTRPTAAHCPADTPNCPNDFPTTPGAYQTKFPAKGGDGFVVKIAEPVLPPTTSTGSSAAGSADTGSSQTPPPASAPVADAGSSKSGGGAIDWLTLPALLAAAALARRRRAER